MSNPIPQPLGDTDFPPPDGTCWCGCKDKPARRGSYFKAGHDRKAEKWLMKLHYGEVVGMLWSHGYGSKQKNIREEAERQGVLE